MNHFFVFRAKKSLGFQLCLAFGGVTFLLALILAVLAGKLVQNRLQHATGQELAHLAEEMARELDRNMFERYREIQIIAGLKPFSNSQTPVAEQQALLDTLKRTYPSYSWIGFANSQGIVQASTNAVLQGQTVAERPWFLGARSAPFVGDVHEAVLLSKLLPPNSSGEPLRFVDFAAPVLDKTGRFQGVLGAHLSWDWARTARDALMDSPTTAGKELFIIAKDGTVLLGPPDWQDKQLLTDSTQLAYRTSQGYVIEEWPDGDRYLTGFTRTQGYQSYPGLGWVILVREKTTLAFAPAQRLYQQILIGGMLFGIGFAALGWQIANQVTRPLLSIAGAAEQIRRGNRAVTIPTSFNQREIVQLAHALNLLINELIGKENELENQLQERQRISDSLQRSEEQLRQIADNIDDALMLRAADTEEIIYFNPGYATLHQLTDPTTAKQTNSWSQLIHPDDQQHVAEKYQAQLQGDDYFNEEYRLIMTDGSTRWIWERSFPIQDETGYTYRYAVIKRDITERKYSEEVLKSLIISTSSVSGESFFPTLVHHLAEALEVEHVLISEQIDDELRSLAFWSHGRLQPRFSYRLEQTPCQITSQQGSYYCQSNVIQHFPNASLLTDLDVEGYFGVVLTNAYGQVLGHLCVLSKSPLDDRIRYAAILHIFATRAATELERQRSELALRDSEERFRLLAENIRDLIGLHEPNGRFLYLSPSCQSLLGFTPDELVHKNPIVLFHPDDRDAVRLELRQIALDGKPSPITYRIRKKTGDYIWLESLVKAIVDHNNQLVYLQSSSRDVTDKIRIQEQLQHDATHDGLTGLPNRWLLLERLDFALERSRQFEHSQFALLFIDLDRFKVINDSLGHAAGDQLLRTVAQKIEAAIRPLDLAARIGGDEFVMLLENISGIQDAIRSAEHVLRQLQTPATLGQHDVVVSASIGIVVGTADYNSSSDILRDADIAMYSAKANGKAGYAIFNPTMHLQALQKLELESDLRRAIERQEFTLHYQPIVALREGRLLGFEALVRWRHASKGTISPAEFIPLAEETGLIVPLGRWILEEACRQMASWQTQSSIASGLKISVNLSVQQLREPGLVSQIERILTDTGLPGENLALEITESMLMQDVEAVSQLLNQLRSHSIQISIDDFGTGFSSLSYLHRLPVNNLKIDRSFITNLCESQRNLNIAETIIALADQLGIDAIAEGIETPEQLQQLEAFGCELGQGYLFSAPVSACVARDLIASLEK